jgi:O-antigen ligase
VTVAAIRLRHGLRQPSWSLAWAIPLGLLCGWLLETRPLYVELPAAALASLPLLLSPRVRLLFIVFGTVFVFGPGQVNSSKLLFLFGGAIAFAGAIVRARLLTRTRAFGLLAPVLRCSILVGVLVIVSLPVAKSNGVTITEWVRDVTPYVLFAWAPLFALDAQSALTARELRRILVLAGIAGAATFAIHWFQARQIAQFSSSTVGLPTFLLSAALFSFALAMALDGRRNRIGWLAMASLVLAILAATGTRSTLALLVAPLVILIGTRRAVARRFVRLIVLLPIVAALAFISANGLITLTHGNQGLINERVRLLLHSGNSQDQSYIARLNETHAAWRLFRQSPVTGVGPGYQIEWKDAEGGSHSTPYVDSPVGFLSDFGLFGLVVLVALGFAVVSTLRGLRRATGFRSPAQLALLGFAATVCAWSVNQVAFEDKGLVPGLVLLLALGLTDLTRLSGHSDGLARE